MSTDLVVRTPMQEVCEAIGGKEFAVRLQQALPSNVTVERFQRVTLTAIQQNPDVIGADRSSLYSSVIRCAQDGLLPNGREAALVIFTEKGKKKVQYLPMIGGLRKRLAEQGIALYAEVVYSNDHFDYELGLEPRLEHRPPKLGEDRGDPIGAYAVAKNLSGGTIAPPEIMDKAEIEKVRKVSRTATSEYGPWVKWWTEMARKTVARRLFKQLPLVDTDGSVARLLENADADVDLSTVPDEGVRIDYASANLPLPDEPVEAEVVDEGQTAFPIPEPATWHEDQG